MTAASLVVWFDALAAIVGLVRRLFGRGWNGLEPYCRVCHVLAHCRPWLEWFGALLGLVGMVWSPIGLGWNDLEPCWAWLAWFRALMATVGMVWCAGLSMRSVRNGCGISSIYVGRASWLHLCLFARKHREGRLWILLSYTVIYLKTNRPAKLNMTLTPRPPGGGGGLGVGGF